MSCRRITLAFLLSAALVCAQAHPRKKAKPKHRGSANRILMPRFDPAAINSPNQADVKQGDKGSAVLRAQILLDRAHFSCGEIDGEFGTNLAKALAAFQQARNVPISPQVDAAAWSALNQDQAPALQSYTITDAD